MDMLFLQERVGYWKLANIDYVDELTTTGTRYQRASRNGSQSIETETAAELLLRIEPILSGEAKRAGMFGNEIALIDRSTGSKLSAFRYFWKTSPYEICPTGKDPQGPHTQMIAAYMIGLRDPSKEEIYKFNWIP